jgi:hypothetical protein
MVSIFMGFDGKLARKYGLSWNESPLDFGYAYPYVIGLLPSGLEMRTLTSPHPVQLIRGGLCPWRNRVHRMQRDAVHRMQRDALRSSSTLV